MKIKRTREVEIEFVLTDDELIQAISEKRPDERLVFFRKLAEADLMKGLEKLDLFGIFKR